MDLAGTPAICVPSGFTTAGLPLSIQFAGRRLSEPMLCRIAYAYEQATDVALAEPGIYMKRRGVSRERLTCQRARNRGRMLVKSYRPAPAPPPLSGQASARFHDKYKELNPERYASDVEKVLPSGKTPAGMHRPIMVEEVLRCLGPGPAMSPWTARSAGEGTRGRSSSACSRAGA